MWRARREGRAGDETQHQRSRRAKTREEKEERRRGGERRESGASGETEANTANTHMRRLYWSVSRRAKARQDARDVGIVPPHASRVSGTASGHATQRELHEHRHEDATAGCVNPTRQTGTRLAQAGGFRAPRRAGGGRPLRLESRRASGSMLGAPPTSTSSSSTTASCSSST